MNVPDQRELWIDAYATTPDTPARPSAFATACLDRLPANATILELGCGAGADAGAFAGAGHQVTATDFVPGVIDANRARLRHLPGIRFETMRIDGPFPYADATFDAVYAHLTLHYFPHDTTVAVFTEISRVLRTGGYLMFACKSPSDPAWGKGDEIEPDMFAFHGKVRHFFSEDYARQLLAGQFRDIEISAHQGRLYRQRAGWITVIARAPQATHRDGSD